MSDRILTPREEVLAKNERLYQQFRDMKTAEGAFHRLTHEFDPSKLSLMLIAETANGIGYDEIVSVVGQVIGNLIIAIAGSTDEPHEAMHDVWDVIGVHVGRVVSGQHQGITVQTRNGHQDEMTLEGLFRETGGGSDG